MAQWHRNIQDIITIMDGCICTQQDEALTLRALAEARGRPPGSGATGLLSVAVPHTPALPEVPLVWASSMSPLARAAWASRSGVT